MKYSWPLWSSDLKERLSVSHFENGLSDILERPPPTFDERIEYGPDPQHFAELRFPDGSGSFPFLFVIHGGFWRSTYDLKHIGSLCTALTSKGIITCNLEYRRIGNAGGGWPGTFQDVSLATDHVLEIFSSDPRVDVARTAVIGHSAGAHLALWLVARHRTSKTSPIHGNQRHRLGGAISLAGVCDLRTAWKQRLGNGVVERLMGGTPNEYPDRFDAGSPIELLPNGSKQVLIHGTADDIVPVSQSEKFVERAEQMGERPTLVKLNGVGHFELIDPESDVWSLIARTVLLALGLG
jgi:acetyl esterase/lipase